MNMRTLGKILAAVLLFFFFFFTALSTADIISVKIRSHNRNMILFSKFEFSPAGYLSIAVSSVGISPIPITSNISQPDSSRIGFVLISDEWLYGYDHDFKENPNLCPFYNKSISVLFTFQDLSPPPHSSFNKSYHVTYPGEYSLYFANCNDLSLVTMDVRTELYNTDDDDDGTTKDYLSANQPNPSLYLKYFLIYLCFLGVWIFISIKNKKYFQMIHLLMGVLLAITVVHLLCASSDQHDLMVTGTHHKWHTFVYIFNFMRNVLFFTVIMLIGSGCCFRKQFLLEGERFILMIVILLQIWANVISIVVGESGPYKEDYQDLIDKFRIIDIICCFVVLFNTLSSSAVSIKEGMDTSNSLALCNGFSTRPEVLTGMLFYYIIYSRGLIIPLQITAPLEAGNFVFYVVMFYLYKPYEEEEDLNTIV